MAERKPILQSGRTQADVANDEYNQATSDKLLIAELRRRAQSMGQLQSPIQGIPRIPSPMPEVVGPPKPPAPPPNELGQNVGVLELLRRGRAGFPNQAGPVGERVGGVAAGMGMGTAAASAAGQAAPPMKSAGEIMALAEAQRSRQPAQQAAVPPAQTPAMGPPTPESAEGPRVLRGIQGNLKDVMTGFRNLGPEYRQSPEQAAERMRLIGMRRSLEEQGRALSGVVNPPSAPLPPERVAAAQARLQQQFADNVGRYGNQPSARDAQPIDYATMGKMRDLGITDLAQFQRMQGLATPVTPERVAASEMGQDRPTLTWDTLKIREQQAQGTAGATMGPQAQPTLNLPAYDQAAAQSAYERQVAAAEQERPVARQAVNDYIGAEQFQRAERDRLRSMAEAQQTAAINTAQAEANAAKYAGSEASLQAKQDLQLQEAAILSNQAKTRLVQSQTELQGAGRQGAISSVEGNVDLTSRLNRVSDLAEQMNGKAIVPTEKAQQSVSDFMSDADAIIRESRAMSREERQALRLSLRSVLPKAVGWLESLRRMALGGLLGPAGSALTSVFEQKMSDLRSFANGTD
jgi:hypothetical protein